MFTAHHSWVLYEFLGDSFLPHSSLIQCVAEYSSHFGDNTAARLAVIGYDWRLAKF